MILVIDDDIMTLEAIKHCLKSNHFEVVVAENSLQALEAIDKFKNKIDLIICDIMMPGFSGLELLSLLKNFYFNTIPVIIVSAYKMSEMVSSAKELGAIDFIPKPIDFNNLIVHIKKCLKTQ